MTKRSKPYTRPKRQPPVVRETHEEYAVGVRELRQNLSVYLTRVKAGEALTVLEHGHPIAVLRPLPRTESALQRMVAEGRATPATRSLADLPPPRPPSPGARPASEWLDDLREERLP